jgi:predicted nucleic-acid-binding Zn-ribbon protein
MKTKTRYGTSARRIRHHRERKSSTRSRTLRGGRTANVVSPEIKYTKGSSPAIKLSCTKCNQSNFLVKTLTMGTKTKSFFAAELLNNRFKIFQCSGCGFVQIFSNSITCDGKSCDPFVKL